jgi:hypothetical protein
MTVNADGRLGPGTVKMTSTIALSGAQPTSGDATITLRKVSPIGSVEPVIDADVKAKLRRESDRWVADIVVSNAGVFFVKPLGETSTAEFAQTIAANLTGAFLVARAFVPRFVQRRSGHLVTIGSSSDHIAYSGNSAYAASKYGVRGMHEVIAVEVAAPASDDAHLAGRGGHQRVGRNRPRFQVGFTSQGHDAGGRRRRGGVVRGDPAARAIVTELRLKANVRKPQ